MATEKQLKDPAEAALSAVEQALNLTPESDKDMPDNGGRSEAEAVRSKKPDDNRQSGDDGSRTEPSSSSVIDEETSPGETGKTTPDPRLPAVEEDELTRSFDRTALDEELKARRNEGEQPRRIGQPGPLPCRQ